MQRAGSQAVWRRPLQRWLDSEPSGLAVPVFLALFVVGWTLCLVLAYHGVGLHFDTVELYALGQTPAFGYGKHPPLAVWMMSAWLWLFPTTDWSAFLLTIVNSAVGLFFVDRIARRFVEGDKRLVALMLTTLIPGYHFLAATFNPNAVLMAAWPMAIHCFLRSFAAATAADEETARLSRQLVWAAAAGVTAALAVLAKYYSVMLLGAFFIAALADPARGRYFKSAVPWISILAGLVTLTPNLVWVVQSGFEPFTFAVSQHAVASRWQTAGYILSFVFGALGYVAIPVGVIAIIAWPVRAAFLRSLVAATPERRMMASLTLALLVLPALTVLIVKTNLPPLWALPGLFLIVIYVVSSPALALARQEAIRVAAAIVLFMLASIAGAPVHARILNVSPPKSGQPFHRPAAEALGRLWRQTTPAPLPAVMGEDDVGWMAAYALPDHPRYIGGFDLLEREDRLRAAARSGLASLCAAAHEGCLQRAQALAARFSDAAVATFTVTPLWWGWPGASAQYVAVVVRPDSVPKN